MNSRRGVNAKLSTITASLEDIYAMVSGNQLPVIENARIYFDARELKKKCSSSREQS